ncbi:DUF4386 domain-containing protein [Aquimarina sediminis]|uniref:DUF4386 domain-containing protein n=1 Tax=Aquimarina sediminis TaxID=2070536 RepID=UPI000CA0584E|nr:DUF4386 domain-containing protein [Aquimarina sediminis]
MTNLTKDIPLHQAALITGVVSLIIIIIAPYAEFFVYPKLLILDQPKETAQNILDHKTLFLSAVFCYLITAIGDIIIAWTVYILLLPVNKSLSLLIAWFRLIFAIISIVALVYMFKLYKLVTTPEYLDIFGNQQFYAQIKMAYEEYKLTMSIGFFLFSIYLILLGYLVLKASYIPKLLGVLLTIAGCGYLIVTLQPFLFPNINVELVSITFLGEVIFMLWLLIRGRKIKEPICTKEI